ncbi:hypothetical protein SAMN05421813_12047 [Daejeonella rubra]|uniref:Uncharacterized protein n=1 Tax=Daejeonella rubra TaxID=990371 RepID=A0A1G9VEY7_9SPHI|nr:hypothetical protein [Daejeonella rubra]SDM70676.1 hypothetical protein SAMN05421813_12047 [Daejeonella rubra]
MKRIFILIGAALILLYSCRKSFLDYEGSDSDEFSIMNVKAHYESLQVGKSIGNTIKNSKSHYVPYWPKAYKAKYGNSEFVEVPLISYKKKIAMYDFTQDSVELKPDKSVRNASFQRMIFFLDKDNKQIQQHIVTYLPDKGYLQKHKFDASHNQLNKMDNDFSGYLEYTGLNGNFIKVLRVMNGKVKGRYTLSPKGISNDSKKGISTSAWVCYQTNCAPSYELECVHDPAYPDNPYASICTETYLGDECAGTYCYENGVGNTTPEPGGGSPSPTNPTYGPDAPCNEKNVIQSRAANTEIQANNIESRDLAVASVNAGTPKEYGAEQNLISLTSPDFKNTTVRTDNNSNSFAPAFKWDSTDGYTIGVTHAHPGGGAPSPKDVFWMLEQVAGYYGPLFNASAADKKFFKDNASITVVTENVSYVVTVRDWVALEQLYHDNTATNENYELAALEYYSNNPFDSYANVTAYALLTLFGSSINLYHAGAGSTYFMPINVYNSTVSNTPCP